MAICGGKWTLARRRFAWMVAPFISLALGPPASAASAEPSRCDAATFRVVIDVGHTEAHFGALSAYGKGEFEFNRRLARELVQKLRHNRFDRAEMVIQADPDLQKRARDLSARRPNLVLSLHHDSVQDKYLKTAKLDGQLRTYTEGFHGYSIFVSRDNGRLDDSEAFARLLGSELRAQQMTPTFHHVDQENRPIYDREGGVFFYDGLVVLRQTAAPAVLLESAVITNPEDERKAEDPHFRDRLTNAITAAIAKFCDIVSARSRGITQPAPKPAAVEEQGAR
jgi:N-acetylmuramoyl-L-alanine amidase